MKRIALILVVFVFPAIAMGQMKKYEYTPKVKNKVEINNLLGEIALQNAPGNAIVIESDFKMDIPERAAGLKLLGAMEDNTEIGINVSEENGIVSIQGVVKQVCDHKFKILVPVGMSVNLNYNSPFANGNLLIDSFRGSLDIHTLSANVKITNSAGPFTVNTISGDVEVVFNSISQDAPSSLVSVSGLVDVTVPSAEKATFGISTFNGNVFNNLDLKPKKEEEPDKRTLTYGLYALKHDTGEFTLNGGGQKVYLKSVSGNIYLRKR